MISILRFLRTLHYLKINQIISRLVWFLKKGILKPFIIHKTAHIKCETNIIVNKNLDLVLKPASKLAFDQEPARNTFNFLNQKIEFSPEIDWNSKKCEKLWLYNLHYFDYLIPLTHQVNVKNFEIGKKIIAHQIAKNPIGKGVGWEPYPISLRIINWMFFYHFYLEYFHQDPQFHKMFLQNLYQQFYYLTWFKELHLGANHLFENIKTIFISSLFFQDRRRFKKSSKDLHKELKEQILPDGGHYERSPMYQQIVLSGLLDILNYLKKEDNKNHTLNRHRDQVIALISDIDVLIKKMMNWLENMCHPDGEIALFGDSAFYIAINFSDLKKYYQAIGGMYDTPAFDSDTISLASSGYYIFRTDSHYFVIDGGPLGVDYQPGHAHCDFLSFEYSYQKLRFIVDSGVGEYKPTDLRQKARGIYSHNTVIVNKLEQGEIWKAFRMGYRIKPGESGFITQQQKVFFRGNYTNSIKKKDSYSHQREVHFVNQKFFLIHDTINGKHIKTIENILHFHPECLVTKNTREVKLKRELEEIYILWNPGNLSVELHSWFYVPEFGKIIENQMIVFKPQIENSVNMYYVIAPARYRDEAMYFIEELKRTKKDEMVI